MFVWRWTPPPHDSCLHMAKSKLKSSQVEDLKLHESMLYTLRMDQMSACDMKRITYSDELTEI